MSTPVGEANAQVDAITQEMSQWPELLASEANTVLDVYIDLKSPHAYLAVRPSLEVARDYDVKLNFLPFTLSYEGLGLSTSVEPDMQRRPPTPAADRRARMYYAAARQYALLQSLPLRSPYRLLDSSLAHGCMLFAKKQQLDVHFAMHAYLAGWSSGWRDFELESKEQLQGALTAVGADLTGLDEYLNQHAQEDMTNIMKMAEESGAVGVPHYVFTDPVKGRETGLFGREHLALIRQKFQDLGLAKNLDVSPTFSHAWAGPKATPS